MAGVHGTRPYGTCNVVPELFYVATFFFHFNFVPLIPLKSYLILGKKKGDTYRVIRIPFHLTSILLAWIRTAAFGTTVVCTFLAIEAFNERGGRGGDPMEPVLWAVCSAFVYAFFMIYPRRVKPSYEKACRYAVLAGLNEVGWAALNVQYGKAIDERPEPAENPVQVR